jgi:DNA topoisomerase-1
MALTPTFDRDKSGLVVKVNGRKAPDHLARLRIPPAWTDVKVDPDPAARVYARGKDLAGRDQRLYSPTHVQEAKAGKFERVRALLSEWEDIRTQIESDLNRTELDKKSREAALVAYLVYETGVRPGSPSDTLAAVKAYGATTLQLRHVKRCPRGVRLQFVGKKGVKQNVLVTNPHLVRVMLARKAATAAYTTRLFDVSGSRLLEYFGTLGSGVYTPKDFRTARGTSLALELLGKRVRIPKAKARRKRIVNDALDRVARILGNTRAVSRASYVDPAVLERFL